MVKYDSLNFLDVDSLFNEEELLVRESVREFVDQEVVPLLIEAHRKEEFPIQLVPEFGRMGFLGANLKGYGCSGLRDVAYGLIMQELERADSGIRSFCSVQGSLVMYPIYAFGNDEQKDRYLPRMAKGELIGCFGLTEPDAGSDPASMRTRAVKANDGYVINGNKMWITNGDIADVAVVWAKLDDEVRGFLVNRGDKGFTTTRMKGKFSLRVSVTSELHFTDCWIPAENALPAAIGLKAPLSCLNQARYGIAWGVLGAANACYHEALHYADARNIFGQPLSSYQLAQAKLVRMATEITKGQLLTLQAGRLKEQGRLTPPQTSMIKMNNCRVALDTARDARDMLGANGIMDEYSVIRHMLNLESVNTYEGTEDIHRLIIGKQLTGKAAFTNSIPESSKPTKTT